MYYSWYVGLCQFSQLLLCNVNHVTMCVFLTTELTLNLERDGPLSYPSLTFSHTLILPFIRNLYIKQVKEEFDLIGTLRNNFLLTGPKTFRTKLYLRSYI